MRESDWTRKVCGELVRMNAVVFAIVGHEMQEVGWPDRFVCHRKWHGFLEFKGEHTRLGGKQALILKRLMERGCPAYVYRYPGTIEDADGRVLCTTDGTGRDLLLGLCQLAELNAPQGPEPG